MAGCRGAHRLGILFAITSAQSGMEFSVSVVLGIESPFNSATPAAPEALGLINVLLFPVLFGLAVGALVALLGKAEMVRTADELVAEAFKKRDEKLGKYDKPPKKS